MGRPVYDFFDGPVADRVVAALQQCSAATMIELGNKGILRIDPSNYIVNYRSLNMEFLSEYCEATGVSARFFLYGTDEQVLPGITDADSSIISLLDACPDDLLDGILNYLDLFFPNEFHEDCRSIARPSRRMTSYISVLPRGLVSFSSDASASMDGISDELLEELKRYRAAGQSKLFIFDSNLWPELAEFTGVSLHWVLNLKVPLYCKKQAADLIFDRYILMYRSERQTFRSFLENIDAHLQ